MLPLLIPLALALAHAPLGALAASPSAETFEKKLIPAAQKAESTFSSACGCSVKIELDRGFASPTEKTPIGPPTKPGEPIQYSYPPSAHAEQLMLFFEDLEKKVPSQCAKPDLKLAICKMKLLKIKKTYFHEAFDFKPHINQAKLSIMYFGNNSWNAVSDGLLGLTEEEHHKKEIKRIGEDFAEGFTEEIREIFEKAKPELEKQGFPVHEMENGFKKMPKPGEKPFK